MLMPSCRLLLKFSLFTLLATPLATQVSAEPAPKVKPVLYDGKMDSTEDITATVARAKAEGKHVILQFGADWCGWCHKLSDMFKNNSTVKQALDANYIVMLVDVNRTKDGKHLNAVVNERYGNPTKLGLPVLVVLDGEGKQLHTQNTGDLETGPDHDEGKVMAFLKAWAPKKL
jgi:thiol:disulfide interchange protein